jgi:hypothetical protein
MFDLDAAMSAVTGDSSSKFFLIAQPAVIKKWALRTNVDGSLAFPGLSPLGGTLAGIPVIASDGVASNTFILIDANQVAAASDMISLDGSRQATIEMQTAPASPPSNPGLSI